MKKASIYKLSLGLEIDTNVPRKLWATPDAKERLAKACAAIADDLSPGEADEAYLRQVTASVFQPAKSDRAAEDEGEG